MFKIGSITRDKFITNVFAFVSEISLNKDTYSVSSTLGHINTLSTTVLNKYHDLYTCIFIED